MYTYICIPSGSKHVPTRYSGPQLYPSHSTRESTWLYRDSSVQFYSYIIMLISVSRKCNALRISCLCFVNIIHLYLL